MKKIYSLMFAVGLSSIAFSQTYDLQVSLATPTSNSTQVASAAVPVEFTITNNGPATIAAGDTMFVGYFKGTTEVFSLTNVPNQASGIVLQSNLSSGSTISTGTYDFDLSSFVNGDTVLVVCYGMGLISLSATGDPNEINLVDNFDLFFIGVPAGIEELNTTITVYPNPTADILNINSSDPIDNITIVGVDGRMVLQANETTSIDVSSLKEGRYIYRITTLSGAIITDSFVKL